MTVFNETRLAAMRAELKKGLADSRLFRNAGFSAVFRAGEETLGITVRGEESSVQSPTSPNADFSLSGSVESWEGYLSGDGKVQHISIAGMLGADVSGGVYHNELMPEGDIVKLFANLPIYDRIVAAAARRHGV